MMMQRQQLVAVEALKDAVIAACSVDQSAQPPPLFLKAGEQSQSMETAASEQPASSQPTLPWWASLATIRIPYSAFQPRPATQTNASQQPCGDQGLDPTPTGCSQPPKVAACGPNAKICH